MRQNGDGEVALEHLKFVRPIGKSKGRRQAEVRSGEGPTCPTLRNRQLTPDGLKTAFGNQGHFISHRSGLTRGVQTEGVGEDINMNTNRGGRQAV